MDEAVSRVFSQDDGFYVHKIETNNYMIVTKNGGSHPICIEMKIEDGILHIDKLNKCGISGTNSLKRIDALAKTLGISEIQLIDGSTIDMCGQRIDLATLKILTNGQSWYNAHGYLSNDFAEEFSHNNEIIRMPCGELLRKTYENSIIKINKNVEKYRKQNFAGTENYERSSLKRIEERNASVIEGFNRWFKEYENTSAQDFFRYITTLMQRVCDKEMALWLEEVLYYISASDTIKYNRNHLIKKIEKIGGKNKKKSSRRKHHFHKRTTFRRSNRRSQ
jgi:hypothetical protein